MALHQVIVVNHYEPELSPAANIANNNVMTLEAGANKETWYANMNNNTSNNNNGTSHTSNAL